MTNEKLSAGMSNSGATSRRRTPGKPGRFEPSEPLHMMTRRHAARSGNDNGSPSLNGSFDDNYSRRGSIDDIRPQTSQSLGSQQSVKDIDMMRSPTRKRKRSSQTPPETPNERPAILDAPQLIVQQYDDKPKASGMQISDRESVGSDEPDAEFGSFVLKAKPSTELTPADSEAVSPISETSNANISLARKVEERVPGIGLPLQPEEPDDVDDVDEGADADEIDEPDEVDDIDDPDDQAKGEGDSRSRRRFYGRRRADHHVPAIEAAMRRQLQLKSSFRAITRALKPVLAEIALKTVEQLEQDPTKHEQVVEFTGHESENGVDQQIAMAFERRKAQLDAQLKWNKLQLQRTQLAGQEISRSKCDLQIEQAREEHLSDLEHQWLVLAREAQVNQHQEPAETDDEDDDIVAKLKGMAYRCQRTTALDSKYDSRSRVAIETQRAIDGLQLRFEMFEMLRDETGEHHVRPVDFTIMDNERRQLAMARRDACTNIQTILAAFEEEERIAKISKIPVIPNEMAHGLQLLGDLVSRPIFDRTPAFLPPPRHLPSLSYVQPGQHSMRPPPLRPPIHMEVHEHDMSPRTQHYMERPTHGNTYHDHSRHGSFSDSSRRDLHLLSPASSTSRAGSLVPLAMKLAEHEHDAHRATMAPYRHASYEPGLHPAERPDSSYRSSREMDEMPMDYYHRRQFSFDHAPRPLPPPDRSVHEFSRGGPLVIERIEPRDSLRHGQHRSELMEDPSINDQAYPPHSVRWGGPQSPEDHDARPDERPSPTPKNELSREDSDNKAPPARNASLNLSAADFNGSKVRAPRQPRHKGVKINFGTKGTKSERTGTTRRASKAQNQEEKRPLEPNSPREAGPSIHRFRLNTDQRPRTPQQGQPWQGSPPRTAPLPLPPSEYIYTSQYGHTAPPPMGFGYGPPPYEHHASYPHPYHHHRNGGPGQTSQYSGPPPLPPPPGGWQHQPHSPLYGVPQPVHLASDPWQQHPPPPPPPPPGYPRAPSSRDGPLSSSIGHAPPHGSPYGPSHFGQYGGPALAPATPDGRVWHAGSGPSHAPAFAQQQRQQEGAGTSTSTGGRQRRRTNSDVPANSKFQHWAPRRRE
ncbi:uncharacterized protein K489DRAFT_375501 [Dissoconium aciculare CBS 342.82]|uniref:Uncharacterized protein n=1 Tax=Dissoconium aciculare CBS 342.82 TaxID=1314786 RepID=A0A6J3MKC9_9PEZI|nr:uncharacterized protein K489DRAFT_375501 [Dissoconium aciculare CBS 342.82]KAF1827407.1 hypothetical protein K489DRAFT_375501 [Dissoconium aciculare CBS 342.82]